MSDDGRVLALGVAGVLVAATVGRAMVARAGVRAGPGSAVRVGQRLSIGAAAAEQAELATLRAQWSWRTFPLFKPAPIGIPGVRGGTRTVRALVQRFPEAKNRSDRFGSEGRYIPGNGGFSEEDLGQIVLEAMGHYSRRGVPVLGAVSSTSFRPGNPGISTPYEVVTRSILWPQMARRTIVGETIEERDQYFGTWFWSEVAATIVTRDDPRPVVFTGLVRHKGVGGIPWFDIVSAAGVRAGYDGPAPDVHYVSDRDRELADEARVALHDRILAVVGPDPQAVPKRGRRGPGSAVRVGPRLRAAVAAEERLVEVEVRAIEPGSGGSIEVRAQRGWSKHKGDDTYAWLQIRDTPGDVARRVVDALSMSSMGPESYAPHEVKDHIGVCFPNETTHDLPIARLDLVIAVAVMALTGKFRSLPPSETWFVGGLTGDGRTRLVEQVVPLWKPFAHEPGGRRALGDVDPLLIAPAGTTVEVDLGSAKAATKVGYGSQSFYGWTLKGIRSLSDLRSFANDQEWGLIPF